MNIKFCTVFILILISLSFTLKNERIEKLKPIKIKWVNNLEGDFSFKESWSYQEGVYKNQYGQLSCDGICPIEIDLMIDQNGKIYKDSLEAFYKIIDTTHIPYSLKSENRMYEYSGTNFISFTKSSVGEIKGRSANNVSTHSSLHIEITNDFCVVWVDFNSIRDLGEHIFPLEEGVIVIDKKLFDEGIVKAVFDFKFKNNLDAKEELFWKGKIYSMIKNE
ncbi:hypothetical protein [Aquimarina longa]|uniref:hypothetical protein n=1 Tax=Aquimarina longa TaxID=1080221 RepID=UPI00078236B8|nr:hypothetical protein [Aquimarina longa]